MGESAISVLSSTHIVNSAYFIVAGAQDRQGGIVTRDRKGAIDTWHLFEKPAKDTKGINLQPDWLRLQTNYDHWEAVPDYDNRRGPGVTNAQTFCNGTADLSCVKKVMTTWPTQNHHTDITSIMCPKTGYIDVTVWTPPVGYCACVRLFLTCAVCRYIEWRRVCCGFSAKRPFYQSSLRM